MGLEVTLARAAGEAARLLVAGLEQPTDGQILIDGVDVAQTPPHKRPVNTVFQSYALFPHLSVKENLWAQLRFSLPRAQRKDAFDKAMEMFPVLSDRRSQAAGTPAPAPKPTGR